MHGGGNVRGDEVQTILQRGEWVTDRSTAKRHRALLAALPRLHFGGPVGGAGTAAGAGPVQNVKNINLTVSGVPVGRIDEKQLVALLRRMELLGA